MEAEEDNEKSTKLEEYNSVRKKKLNLCMFYGGNAALNPMIAGLVFSYAFLKNSTFSKILMVPWTGASLYFGYYIYSGCHTRTSYFFDNVKKEFL